MNGHSKSIPVASPSRVTVDGYLRLDDDEDQTKEDALGFASDGSAWVLAVTLAFAEDLECLVTADEAEKSSSLRNSKGASQPLRPFYLYYNLLGLDIKTESFYDLKHAEFAAERTFFRLQASVAALRHFLNEQRALNVFLCRDNNLLGICEVDLTTLLDKDGVGQLTERVCIFCTPKGENVNNNRLQRDGWDINEDIRSPVLGVALSLVRETDITRTPPMETKSMKFQSDQVESKPDGLDNEQDSSVPIETQHQESRQTELSPHKPSSVQQEPWTELRGDDSGLGPRTQQGQTASWRELFQQSDEYRVALELERWKHEEQEKFTRELRDQQAQITRALQQQWQEREHRRLSELALERAQLKRQTEELSQREASVRMREEALMKVSADGDSSSNAKPSERLLVEELFKANNFLLHQVSELRALIQQMSTLHSNAQTNEETVEALQSST